MVIEQAKGVLAEHGRVDMSTAYAALRRFSRNHNQKIAEVAEHVVGRTTSLDAVLETSPSDTRICVIYTYPEGPEIHDFGRSV